MKTNIAKILMAAVLLLPFAAAIPAGATSHPEWDTTGSYMFNMNYLGSDYAHDVSLTQSPSATLTGNGGSPVGSNVYTWVIDSGSVSGSNIAFQAHYTATADAVTPLTTMTVTGVISPAGTITGTWYDNYQGGNRSGTFTTLSGSAVAIPPPAEKPANKDECKNGGWKTFSSPSFKNQGQCVSSVAKAR